MSKAKLKAQEFDSLTELVQYIDSTPARPNTGDSSTEQHRDNSWDLGVNFEEAMTIARSGGKWAEGAAQITKGVAQAAVMRTSAPMPMFSNDVAGIIPDVPAYLMGAPDCMVTIQEPEQGQAARPIVKLCVGAASCGTKASAIMNQGIAVLSLTDALEGAGYRVEIDWVTYCAVGSQYQLFRVRVKQSTDQWSPEASAFMMAHPAMQRRLMFAVKERTQGFEALTRGGYGSGNDEILEQYDIGAGYMIGDRGNTTLAAALGTMQTKARDAGFDVTLVEGT